MVAAKEDYANLEQILATQNGETTLQQRKQFAAKAFEIVMKYDIAISNFFSGAVSKDAFEVPDKKHFDMVKTPISKRC